MTTHTRRHSIDVRFDKISLAAAQAVKMNGGRIEPAGNGRYWMCPPTRCRWGGSLHAQTLRLPNQTIIRCLPHDETVELLLEVEYQTKRAGKNLQ
jgi:hypothetical protein